MNSTEKIIIKRVISNLRGSTNTPWNQGGLSEWAKFAKDEKAMILSSISILEGLCEADGEETKSKKEEDLLGG